MSSSTPNKSAEQLLLGSNQDQFQMLKSKLRICCRSRRAARRWDTAVDVALEANRRRRGGGGIPSNVPPSGERHPMVPLQFVT